jgi:rhamnosyltransferase
VKQELDVTCPVVTAVIVVYRPNFDDLTAAIKAIVPQVGLLLLIDNGGLGSFCVTTNHNIEVISMGRNVGIAAAQNTGIKRATSLGAEYVLLLDQDSVAAPDMVRCLLSGLEERKSEGAKVAACGPRYLLGNSHEASAFLVAGAVMLRATTGDQGRETTACDFLIASGMLIPMQTLTTVGLMDDSLFIDHVDTEWCFRASSLGFRCFGVSKAFMRHRLGQSCRSVGFWGRRRQLPRHVPFRYYFIVRNSILLRRRSYMPPAWRRHDCIRLAGLMLFHSFSAKGGFCALRMSIRGLVDGLLGRSGPGPFV